MAKNMTSQEKIYLEKAKHLYLQKQLPLISQFNEDEFKTHLMSISKRKREWIEAFLLEHNFSQAQWITELHTEAN